MSWEVAIAAVSLLGAFILTLWRLIWWLSGQFTDLRGLIYNSGQKILDKLEYHERHDDQRFAEVNNALWEIRLSNANGMPIKRKENIDGQELRLTS